MNHESIRFNDNYCERSASNYSVKIGRLNIYWSYNTIIAFSDSTGLYCSVNEWGTTTGKHLNAIEPNKKARIPHEEVLKKLDERLADLVFLTEEQKKVLGIKQMIDNIPEDGV